MKEFVGTLIGAAVVSIFIIGMTLQGCSDKTRDNFFLFLKTFLIKKGKKYRCSRTGEVGTLENFTLTERCLKINEDLKWFAEDEIERFK